MNRLRDHLADVSGNHLVSASVEHTPNGWFAVLSVQNCNSKADGDRIVECVIEDIVERVQAGHSQDVRDYFDCGCDDFGSDQPEWMSVCTIGSFPSMEAATKIMPILEAYCWEIVH